MPAKHTVIRAHDPLPPPSPPRPRGNPGPSRARRRSGRGKGSAPRGGAPSRAIPSRPPVLDEPPYRLARQQARPRPTRGLYADEPHGLHEDIRDEDRFDRMAYPVARGAEVEPFPLRRHAPLVAEELRPTRPLLREDPYDQPRGNQVRSLQPRTPVNRINVSSMLSAAQRRQEATVAEREQRRSGQVQQLRQLQAPQNSLALDVPPLPTRRRGIEPEDVARQEAMSSFRVFSTTRITLSDRFENYPT